MKNNFPENANYPISNQHLRKAMYSAFSGKCFYTGQKISFKEMHIDHVIPRSKGGPDNIYNYVVSSARMNLAKKDKIDNVAVEGVLAINRTHFSPKALKLLAVKQNKKVNKPLIVKEIRKPQKPPAPSCRFVGLREFVEFMGKHNRNSYLKIGKTVQLAVFDVDYSHNKQDEELRKIRISYEKENIGQYKGYKGVNFINSMCYDHTKKGLHIEMEPPKVLDDWLKPIRAFNRAMKFIENKAEELQVRTDIPHDRQEYFIKNSSEYRHEQWQKERAIWGETMEELNSIGLLNSFLKEREWTSMGIIHWERKLTQKQRAKLERMKNFEVILDNFYNETVSLSDEGILGEAGLRDIGIYQGKRGERFLSDRNYERYTQEAI